MVKYFILLSLLYISVAEAQPRSGSAGAGKPRHFHMLAAFSTNFSFPGSLRVGYSEWELGRLTPFAYGFDKIFDLSQHTYAAFGFAVASGLGLYGGVGFSYSWFGFGVRGELTSVIDFAGFSQGLGILGVSYGF